MDILFIVAGIALLYYGGDFLVTGCIHISQRFKISPFVIGATVVGFGTSAPELAVSVLATLQDAPEMAMGNALGSNIANVCLGLGLTAALTPLFIEKARFNKETPALLASTFLILILAWDLEVTRLEGILLIICLAAYLWVAFSQKEDIELEVEDGGKYFAKGGIGIQALIVAGGLFMTLYGAKLLVDGSVGLARDFGISEWLIGITIMAVGTSLPEIVSALIAAFRGHAEMSIGNIYGSNIFNILMVIGTASAIHPLYIEEPIHPDLLITSGLTCLFLVLLKIDHGLSKIDGLILLLCYVAYIGSKSMGIV